MSSGPKNADVETLYRAVGAAISTWSLVELSLYQIFSACLTLTIARSDGMGWSSFSDTPTRTLDAVSGWRLKLEAISAALAAALDGLEDDEARDILNTWAVVSTKANDLHKSRSKLAHWRAELLGNSIGQKVRLAPPSRSLTLGSKEGAWETDIQQWQSDFAVMAGRLGNIAQRLADHKGLQRKFVEQVASLIRPALHNDQLVAGDPTLAEYLRQLLTEHHLP